MAGIVHQPAVGDGRKFWVEGTLAHGAGGRGLDQYRPTKSTHNRFNGANVGAAWAMDSVFGALASTNGATGQQLTNFFSIAAALEHYWTPALRSASSPATAPWTTTTPRRRCSARPRRARSAALAHRTRRSTARRWPWAATPTSTCGTWACGRSGYRAPQFDVGVEVMYTQIETKNDPNQVALNFAGAGGWLVVSTSRRAKASGPRSCVCSAISGHDGLIIAVSSRMSGSCLGNNVQELLKVADDPERTNGGAIAPVHPHPVSR